MEQYGSFVEARILQAAKVLFAQKGHEETKFQEIAAKARTSESQMVKYFGSKAGILDVLFSKARLYIDEPFERICKEKSDPIAILEKTSELLFDFYRKDRELLAVYLFSRRYYKQIAPERLIHGARFRKQLAGIFRRGQEEKVFRNDFNPEVAASALWGAIQGMMRDKYYTEKANEFPDLSFEDMAAVSRTLIRSFVKGK
jgi:AcrR family transcriptional regulator